MSVVDQTVETAEGSDCLGDGGCGDPCIGDITPEEADPVAELCDDLLTRLGVDVHGHDLSAFGGQASRDAQPDSRCAAGDDERLVLQLHFQPFCSGPFGSYPSWIRSISRSCKSAQPRAVKIARASCPDLDVT